MSGPGALSARTDGGPAKGLVPPAASHGDRAAIEAQLSATPPAGSPGTVAGGGPTPAPVMEALPGTELPDVFAPTNRPGESPTTLPQGPSAQDDDVLLRALYLAHPSPWLLNLIRES